MTNKYSKNRAGNIPALFLLAASHCLLYDLRMELCRAEVRQEAEAWQQQALGSLHFSPLQGLLILGPIRNASAPACRFYLRLSSRWTVQSNRIL